MAKQIKKTNRAPIVTGPISSKRAQNPDRLGMMAQKYLNKRTPSLSKNAVVADIWQEILPEVFYEHCSLAGISRGVLHIEVDPGPFMHELQILSSEILSHLHSRCGITDIGKVKLHPRLC